MHQIINNRNKEMLIDVYNMYERFQKCPNNNKISKK